MNDPHLNLIQLHISIRDIEVPQRMRDLPLSKRGFPVPRFVQWVDGEPEFRIMDHGFLVSCLREGRCWICGDKLGAYRTYVAGPMCGVNRTSGEPPSHRECAIYAAKACPFLARPHARRRDAGLPEEVEVLAGKGIMRNPGVAMLWTTKGTKTKPDGQGGLLFDIGDPTEVLWIAHGREATRAEVMESIRTGLPILERAAEEGGPSDVRALKRMLDHFTRYVPNEVEEGQQ